VSTLGLATARKLLLAATEISATEMLEVGFLDHLVSASCLHQKTEVMANNLASHAPLALTAMKQILNQASSGKINVRQAMELSQHCSVSEDFQEGLRAQRQKRSPDFIGQ
jgi:enoyl-CoA hydratase/carnithine racemase